MPTLVLRNTKGTELTFTEVDANFTNLNTTTNGAVTAAGSTQGTATAVTDNIIFVTTSSVGSGIVLATPDIGEQVNVVNHTVNIINIYPASGHTIDAGTVNVPLPLNPGNAVLLVGSSATNWTGVSFDIWDDENNALTIPFHPTTPPTPPAGVVSIFGKKLGFTRIMPAAVGPSGMDYTLQPALWRQKIGMFNSSSTVVAGVFGASFTVVGTLTARTLASTSLFTRIRRLGYVSAATAAALISIRNGAAQFSTGTGTGVAGFFQSIRFAVTDAAAVTGARMFLGVSSTTTAPTNVEANTLLNCIGVGQLSTDATQLYLFTGGSAAQAAIPLGTGFPCIQATAGIANGIPYDFMIWCPPNGNGVVSWQLDRIDTGTTTGGTITPGTPGLQTPLNTTMLNTWGYRTNNATLLAVGLDIINIYTETDL